MLHDKKSNRRTTRLKGYDYSRPGWYFVTICTQDRAHRFGVIDNQHLDLNDAGQMVEEVWRSMLYRFSCVAIDEYVVMPDHFHAILQIMPEPTIHPKKKAVGTPFVGVRNHTDGCVWAETPNDCQVLPGGTSLLGVKLSGPRIPTRGVSTLGGVIGAFKSLTTNGYIQGVKQQNWPPFQKRLWQMRYHERVIRGEDELARIRKYIIENPLYCSEHGDG